MFYVSHSLILSKSAGFWENKGGMLCLRTNRFCKVNEHISVHLVISATVSQSVLKLLFYISSTFLLPLFRLSVKTNVFSVFSPLPLYFPTSFFFILPILFFSTVAIVVCWPSLTWVPGIFSGSKWSRHQLGSTAHRVSIGLTLQDIIINRKCPVAGKSGPLLSLTLFFRVHQ